MKIVILNGSPRKGGNTEIMADAFAEAAGKKHEVVRVDVGQMNIRGCLGCGYCRTHDKQCVQKDDMTKVKEALAGAEMVVFASPIYWFDITAQLKAAIDRLYDGSAICWTKTALLLDSGADNVYDAAIAQYKGMTSYLKWEDMGIVCVPMMKDKGSMKDAPQLAEVIKLAESL
jgi:multimeric flavodoxin WrbA